MRRRSTRFVVFTCDRGRRLVDVGRDSPRRIAATLQEVIEAGFWRQLDKFPTDVIARHLHLLDLPRHTRRLLEIWIEERREARRSA